MKLWAGLSIWYGFSIAACACVIIAVFVSGWRSGVESSFLVISQEISQRVLQVTKSHIDTVKLAASVVPISLNDWSGQDLLQFFRSLERSAFRFRSAGFLMHHNTSQTAKLSWQVSVFPSACPGSPGLFFSNSSIHPQFRGYCEANGTIDFSKLAFSGSDWGLKPQEVGLLSSSAGSGTFLPVFTLPGGLFVLPFETKRSFSVDVASFAELELGAFSAYFTQNISVYGGKGVAFIVENGSDQMIASTRENTVFFSNGTRQTARGNENQMISDAFNGRTSSLLVSRFFLTDSGLNWTGFVVVERSEVFGSVYQTTIVASVICASVALVFILLTIAGTIFWVNRPLAMRRNNQKPFTPFEELNELD
jgi:hypothetical protein